MQVDLIDAVNHYDYTVVDESCPCVICGIWREKRDIYLSLGMVQKTQHFKHVDKAWRDALYALTAVTNRRELYCEMSFHAAHTYPVSGAQLMAWVATMVSNPELTDGWWVHRSPGFSLEYWIQQFKRSATKLALPEKKEVSVAC